MQRRMLALVLALLLVVPGFALAETLDLGTPVVLRGAAVAETPKGLVGSTATFTVTAAKNGSGHVFLDTFPLTQVDMQGSARLAARVAAQATGKDLAEYDLFFVIRSGSVQIGGPSAGATLAVGAIAALNAWEVRPDVLMTGTISPDGTVGPVGGVAEKAKAASDAGMRRFLFPAGEETVPLSTNGNQPIDLREYCRRELSMECVPVGDVYEAVENMTDHAFLRPPLTGNVTGEGFRQRLGPLSGELLDAARARLREAEAEVGQVPPGDARAALDGALGDARAKLASAESAAANGTYYTASSLSFQASIAARDARDRARIARAANPAEALQESIREAAEDVQAARDDIEGETVEDTSAFDFVAAAQVRLLDAEARLDAARQQADANDASSAVASAAFAGERAATAQWWLRLGGNVEPGAAVDPEGLADAARDAITTSTEEIAYVEAVLSSAGVGVGPVLDGARAQLDQAENAMARGFVPAAMLNALEAQVRASDVLLLASFSGTIPPARLEAARVGAARAIQAARERGVEPLLAESEYEFALSLEDASERLTFLGLARVTANLAGLPGLFGASHREVLTRFQGPLPDVGVPAPWVAGTFALGLALGVGMGLAAMLPRDAKRRAPPL